MKKGLPFDREAKDTYLELYRFWKSWNDPIFKVAENGIHSISEFTLAIENFIKEHQKVRIREELVFRGESETYKTYLKPKLARNKSVLRHCTTYENKFNLTKLEVREVRDFQKTKMGKLLMRSLSPNAVDWLPLARHYGGSTRLLDVTRNALVALYFACVQDIDKDGWVFAIKVSGLRPQSRNQASVGKRDIEQGIPGTFLEVFEPTETQCVYENAPHFLHHKYLHLRE